MPLRYAKRFNLTVELQQTLILLDILGLDRVKGIEPSFRVRLICEARVGSQPALVGTA
jgi:hypothetical protein